jgi:serine/threonine-protein kinase SRPK3
MVHQPLGLQICDFQELIPGEKLPQEILKLILKHILLALEFLHSECDLAHTGKSTGGYLSFWKRLG